MTVRVKMVYLLVESVSSGMLWCFGLIKSYCCQVINSYTNSLQLWMGFFSLSIPLSFHFLTLFKSSFNIVLFSKSSSLQSCNWLHLTAPNFILDPLQTPGQAHPNAKHTSVGPTPDPHPSWKRISHSEYFVQGESGTVPPKYFWPGTILRSNSHIMHSFFWLL